MKKKKKVGRGGGKEFIKLKHCKAPFVIEVIFNFFKIKFFYIFLDFFNII